MAYHLNSGSPGLCQSHLRALVHYGSWITRQVLHFIEKAILDAALGFRCMQAIKLEASNRTPVQAIPMC